MELHSPLSSHVPTTIREITSDHVTAAFASDFNAYTVKLFDESRRVARRPLSIRTFWPWLTDIHIQTGVNIVDRVGSDAPIPYAVMEDRQDTNSIPFWVRDNLATPKTFTRLWDVSKRRMAVIATILKGADFKASAMWGIRPANDSDFVTIEPKLGDFFLASGRLEAPRRIKNSHYD